MAPAAAPPPDPSTALAGLWRSAGGDPAALGHARLTGGGAVLPSSFAVALMAQCAIAALGLAAAQAWQARSYTWSHT